MRTYAHYIGETVHGGIVEVLIDTDNLESVPAEDYFKPSWKDMEKQGDIEMEGPTEHMLNDTYTYEF